MIAVPDAITLAPDVCAALIREAARAPSVHNVQPARWRFDAKGDVVLFRAIGRDLPVADPSGHDVRASLGAAFEGLSLALSRMQVGLTDVRAEHIALADGCEPVLRATLRSRATVDPLAAFVPVRRSFRGTFVDADDDARARLRSLGADDARVVVDTVAIADAAVLHDAATWHFESQAAYHAELWRWLRLDPSDPLYTRDGLNADCLALSSAERIAARVALRPGVFAVLTSLGIARHLVSEKPQVESAAGLVFFTPLRVLDAFDVGRRFYRLWLEIARAGLHAVPMSASADHAPTRDALARTHAIPDDRRLANVLRVGGAPASGVAESPRLPAVELLV